LATASSLVDKAHTPRNPAAHWSDQSKETMSINTPHNASEASLSAVVSEGDTAAAYGTHFPKAAATPFVLGLAEVACHRVVAPALSDGEVTVGTHAVVAHLLPSPVGATLTAHARLVERDGRRLRFAVEVLDGEEVCARVEHDRAVVRSDKIEARLLARS
jgi:predicted thioesterase